MRYLLIAFLALSSLYAKADCEPTSNEKIQKSYELYLEAKELIDDENYKSAYEKINESYKLDTFERPTISLSYKCTHYIQTGYIPKITSYPDTRVKPFKRKAVASLIKKYLNPNPYIVIQKLPNSLKITVANVQKTSRGNIDGQLSLENVSISVGGDISKNLNFTDIASNTQKTQTIYQAVELNRISVSMNERFDITLFPKSDK